MRIGRVTFTMAVVLVALAASGCSRKRYKIPSGAMFPTLAVGDHVTADTSVAVPTRGDVFVFLYPEHPEQSFVKRVVGLPGDRVEVAGQKLSINGRALDTCVVGHYGYAEDDGTSHDGELVLENGGAATYLLFYDRSGGADGSWIVSPASTSSSATIATTATTRGCGSAAAAAECPRSCCREE